MPLYTNLVRRRLTYGTECSRIILNHDKGGGLVIIRVPVQYATIADGEVSVELLTTAQAKLYLGNVSQATFDRWKGRGWIPEVDSSGIRASLFTRYDLDRAVLQGNSPIREWIRTKQELVEEVIHG